MNKLLPEHSLVLPNADDVANEALKLILEASTKSIEAHGFFRIVLAGGTTPRKIYALLAKQSCDWNKWHLYLGDERCLPIDDIERNSEMIRISLLDKIDIPAENIHFIPAELGTELATQKYAKTIAEISFDLVMLGMGEDGHTASLFPDNIHNTDELVHAVHNSPKPPKERISLSAKALSNNQVLLIIVTSKNKQKAVARWQAGDTVPVSTINTNDRKIVLLDEAAA